MSDSKLTGNDRDGDEGIAWNGIEVAFVIIGRNEGPRLLECLKSIAAISDRLVYVDSGSTDGSAEVAKRYTSHVWRLDARLPFTAARARNEGAAYATRVWRDIRFIQFVDGDCVLRPEWPAKALIFLASHGNAAVACGRRRERFPQNSIYNQLCDMEWGTPIGEAAACGGDAMFRIDAFQSTGGFRGDLIAGEEPELCSRLRRAGWSIWRLDEEMTAHDADIRRFSQWWRRCMRAGYAEADISLRIQSLGSSQERRRLLSSVIWGLILPIATFTAVAGYPFALLALLAYPMQAARISLRTRGPRTVRLAYGTFLMIAKLAQLCGLAKYLLNLASSKPKRLIEYKTL